MTELYAHCEILDEQLHPTKGNPPLIPLPHLRKIHDKFDYYINLKIIKNDLRAKRK